jgi:hypothetical protein
VATCCKAALARVPGQRKALPTGYSAKHIQLLSASQ